MKPVGFTLLFLLFSYMNLSCSRSNKNDSENTEKAPPVEQQQEDEMQSVKHDFTAFLSEILIGYEITAIHKYMIHTQFEFLGEDKGRYNFEGKDENKVNHFVSFVTYSDNVMNGFVYNLDFNHENSNLVMDYQKKIQAQLQEVYGDDFQTGFDDYGFYILDWYFDAGTLIFTTGLDFISVELREH